MIEVPGLPRMVARSNSNLAEGAKAMLPVRKTSRASDRISACDLLRLG